jgi:hypothetical protein
MYTPSQSHVVTIRTVFIRVPLNLHTTLWFSIFTVLVKLIDTGHAGGFPRAIRQENAAAGSLQARLSISLDIGEPRIHSVSATMLGWKAIFTLVVVALMFFVLALNKFNDTLVIFLAYTLYEYALSLFPAHSHLMHQIVGCYPDELH